MTILMDYQDGQILVVENSDLAYRDLRLVGTVVGTDYWDGEGRRVLGLTETRPDRRDRGPAVAAEDDQCLPATPARIGSRYGAATPGGPRVGDRERLHA